jgi:signal transduction histidine kinase
MNDQLSYALLEQQPVAIIYYQPVIEKKSGVDVISDFRIIYSNAAAAAQSGLTTEQITGKTLFALGDFYKDIKSLLFDQLLKVYTTGETADYEYFNPQLQKHFRVYRNKVLDGVLNTARDITEEINVRKEKELQTSLADKILDISLNGWFYCETIRGKNNEVEDFIISRINPGFSRITGLSDAETTGKKYLDLFPSSKQNGVFELNERVVNTRKSERQQMHYHGDKINAWYDVMVSPFGADGILITFADITLIKQSELESAKLAETLQTIFDTVQVGIFIFKPVLNDKKEVKDFRFALVNPTLSNYVAQEPETLIGQLGSEWFPGYLHNGVFDMYRNTYDTGNTNRKQFHYNEDGMDMFLDLQSSKIGDEVLVSFSDFTPLQLAQLELQKSIGELERSNQNLEEFARAASHDLKEPVRKFQLFTDKLKRTFNGTANAEVTELFERMESASLRMKLLIDDLLEYSHVTGAPQKTEPVDLNEIIQLVTGDLEIMIEETESVIEHENLPVINGYRRQLQQLFLNLFNNAIKYRKKDINPHVYIHSKETTGAESKMKIAAVDENKRFLKVEISDNGIGFDQADAEKIFHVFTRLHNKKEYAGTGLGLSIVSKVMENHKGYIFANGVKNQGATFTLLFPV